MSTFFIDLGTSAGQIAHGVLSDCLGLSTRPLAMLYSLDPSHFGMLKVMVEGDLLPGFVSTISVGLVGISVGALCAICGEACCGMLARLLLRLAGLLYTLDGALQLPTMLWPPQTFLQYMVSRTGVLVFLQLRFGPVFLTDNKIEENCKAFDERYGLMGVAVTLRYISLAVVDPSGATAWILTAIAVIFLVFAVTPKAIWKLIQKVVERVAEALQGLCSIVYAAVEYLVPKIQRCIVALLQNRFLIRMYQLIILPSWEALSPWFVPTALVVLAYFCFADVRFDREGYSMDKLLTLLGQICCGALASISALVLGLHAGFHICPRSQPDPLKFSAVAMLLSGTSSLLSFPWRCGRFLCTRLWSYILWPLLDLFLNLLSELAKFAVSCPFLSIPLVLAVNICLMWYLATHAGILTPLSGLLEPYIGQALESVLRMQGAVVTGRAKDSTLALLLIVIVQMGTYVGIASVLDAVRIIRKPRTGDALTLDELNALAAAMSEPRQCGRCGFGPVDHRGCSNLSTHHMEVSVRGGNRSTISNACPRCGWFTGNLSDWPAWDGDMQTERGRAMFRQRVWCEIVVVVRAASKALLVPFAMLILGAWLTVPPSVSAFLAFSYLLPWTHENAKLAASLNNPNVYRSVPRRIASSPDAGGDDCGATPQTALLPDVSQSEALKNITSAKPEQVFLAEGDICSVCLEPFPQEASAVVASYTCIPASDDSEVSKALLSFNPPIVALRCGHPLHVDCAEAAVRASSSRHVRCPLCREPVTLAGSATAVAFS